MLEIQDLKRDDLEGGDEDDDDDSSLEQMIGIEDCYEEAYEERKHQLYSFNGIDSHASNL